MQKQEKPFKEWAGLLVIQNRKLLVIKEPSKPFFFLPGGKVEPGETNEDATVREVKEELGVQVGKLVLYTDLFEPSWSNNELYRYRCFFGALDTVPGKNDLPKTTEAIDWIDSSSEIELGTIPQKLLIELLRDGHID